MRPKLGTVRALPRHRGGRWGGGLAGVCVPLFTPADGAMAGPFVPARPACACVASAAGRIWYPSAMRLGAPIGSSTGALGASLRGHLEGESEEYIVVDPAL